MLIYFNSDHEEGNPDCGRCRSSAEAIQGDDYRPQFPERCKQKHNSEPCTGLVHVDAESLRPGGDVFVVARCDVCGSDGWFPGDGEWVFDDDDDEEDPDEE